MAIDQILVVDDERRGIELLARALRSVGEISTASNATMAWDLIATRSFSLVISDQRMPGETGVELLTRVANEYPLTGRILLTGFADQHATVSAINEARIHAYLYKPCPPDQLRVVAGNVIARVKLERENRRLIDDLRDRAEELEEVVASLKLEVAKRSEDAYLEGQRDLDRILAPLISALAIEMTESVRGNYTSSGGSSKAIELVAQLQRAIDRSY